MSTFTDGIDASPVTQTSFADNFKYCWVTLLGYTVVDDYTASSIRNLVFQHVTTAGKTYGGIYFRFQITSALAISETFGTAYDATTKVLTNAGTVGISVTFVNTAPISFKAIRSGRTPRELDYVIAYQGLTSYIGGWKYPSNPNNVDENFASNYYHWLAYGNRTLRSIGTAGTLFNASSFSIWGGNMCLANHYSKNDLASQFLIYIDAKSAVGLTSDDFALGAGNGLNLFGKVGDYFKISDGGNSQSSIFLK